MISLQCQNLINKNVFITYRLCSLDSHKPVVALLPADVAKGPVVPRVLGDVADLVDRVVMQQHLHSIRCTVRWKRLIMRSNLSLDLLEDEKTRLVRFESLPFYIMFYKCCTLCWQEK